MWAVIGAILKLASLILSAMFEKNKHKRKMKKDAVKEVADGIKKKDPSAITAGFSRLKSL